MNKFDKIAILLYFALTFFEPFLNVLIGSFFKLYIIFLLILLNGKFKRKVGNNVIMLVAWFLYQCFTIIWSEDYTAFEMFFLSECLILLLLTNIFVRIEDEDFLKQIFYVLCFSGAIFSILSFFFSEPYISERNESRQVITLFGAQMDPNNQAAFSTYSFIIGLYYSKTAKLKWKVIFYLIAMISFISIINTGSRDAYISLIVSSLCLLWYLFQNESTKDRRGGSRAFVNIVVLIIAAMTIPYYIFDYLNEDAVNRIMSDEYGDGSERTMIWSNTWNIYTSNLIYVIFGRGWGTANLYTGVIYREYYSIHNTFLAILANTGIVGLGLFIYPILNAAKKLYNSKYFLPLILLISQLVIAIFLECINKRFFWNSLYLVFAAESSLLCKTGSDGLYSNQKE